MLSSRREKGVSKIRPKFIGLFSELDVMNYIILTIISLFIDIQCEKPNDNLYQSYKLRNSLHSMNLFSCYPNEQHCAKTSIGPATGKKLI